MMSADNDEMQASAGPEIDWQKLVDVQAAVLRCDSCRTISGKDPNSPQPSYVGANYRRGGLVVLLQNPGSPPKDWDNEEREVRLAETLRAFRDAPSLRNYHGVVAEIHRQMIGGTRELPAWRSWLHPVKKCVEGIATPQDFTWVNVVKHRTPGGVETNRAIMEREETHGVKEHLQTEIDVLAPSVILAVGAPAARALSRLVTKPRTILIGQRASTEEADRVRRQLLAILKR